MYAQRMKLKPTKEVDFIDELYEMDENGEPDYEKPIPKEKKEIAYWRKHPDLHGWMERLYREKGGEEESFNGSVLVLTLEDLDRLEEDILRKNLPKTSGFFFGQSDDEISLYDLEFVLNAREAIREGDTVYYDSSW